MWRNTHLIIKGNKYHEVFFCSPLTFSTGKYVKLADGAILVQVWIECSIMANKLGGLVRVVVCWFSEWRDQCHGDSCQWKTQQCQFQLHTVNSKGAWLIPCTSTEAITSLSLSSVLSLSSFSLSLPPFLSHSLSLLPSHSLLLPLFLFLYLLSPTRLTTENVILPQIKSLGLSSGESCERPVAKLLSVDILVSYPWHCMTRVNSCISDAKSMPYSRKFSLVQTFAKLLISPSEEI